MSKHSKSRSAVRPSKAVPPRPHSAGWMIALVVLMLVGLGAVWLGTQRGAQPSGELEMARQRLERVAQEDQLEFADFQRAVENVLHQTGYLRQPLTPSMVDVLSSGAGFFERFVAFHAEDPRSEPTRARVHHLLGRIHRRLGQMDRAEVAFRDSQRTLLRSIGGQDHAETQLGLAIAENALSCLLVDTGRLNAAATLQVEVVKRLEQLAAVPSLSGVSRAQLALALRNWGLIAAAAGRDGTAHVKRSVELVARDSGRVEESVEPQEFLIDSYQILAELYFRCGEISAASAACRRSLELLDQLRSDVRSVSSRMGYTPASRAHGTARILAAANLELLGSHQEGQHSAVNSWRWRLLHPMPGEALRPDILVKARLPAEFERQDALLINWLDRPWLTDVLAQVVAAVWQQTQVVILVEDELLERSARKSLAGTDVDTTRLLFFKLATETAWARDWGPLIVSTSTETHRWVDPISTANLRFARFRDDHVPTELARLLEVPVVEAPIFLHGGGLLTNGAGLCVVAKSQLSWNAELGISEPHVTTTLKRLCGAEQIEYVETLVDEPTEHVDWFAAFTAVDSIVVGDYRGADPVNTVILDRCAAQLAGLSTPAGPLKVHRIPMPARGDDYFGGTYTNVVFANGVLLVPTWPDSPAENAEAIELYGRLLPDWKVVGIDCSSLVAREGALRCATRNLYRLPKVD